MSAPRVKVDKGVDFNILGIYIIPITLRETCGVGVDFDILNIYITSIALRESDGVEEVEYIKNTEDANKVKVYPYLELAINISTSISVNKNSTTS
jgi:hypothetical protein